ncbi:peptidoglycan -binding protein [Acetobacteraceae bacterium KSS8]|uniref:Peptidoglycan -binding protein n=1 Tax=Endosaccharibacter trunci TaxID=2812733 RepID=A0ABT1W833_9PROT|nr:peptidoglycan -binding protein [Acetobacteraceae bacterium KSS8]
MARRRGARGNGLDAWPGYVDALSTLLMVIIFVLLVFVLAQAFLSAALTGRQTALDKLTREMNQLTQLLSMEKGKVNTLQLSVATLNTQHEKDLAAHSRDAAAEAALQQQLSAQTKLGADAQNQVTLLNQQLAELQKQLAAIAAALDISRKDVADRDAKITDLGNKLNLALADKVEELKRYRSEFFGRLSALLAHKPGIRVVGDRFVFQSEVLFPVGSADLSPAGRDQIKTLAKTLKQIGAEIPKDIPWILRVDGHADRQPIKGSQFPTNWELSAARAITVVKLLIAEGIPPQHLAATAFSQYQPIDNGSSADAMAHNRRIELRLTDR